jgi:hypothetical protein
MKNRSNSSNSFNRSNRAACLPARQEGAYANGDIECKALDKRVDQSICTVQSFRFPKKCDGCRYGRKT